ncbi:hypothetical protein DFH11DRAFT_1515335 [Phellopilus nigrolimitatus]|nr:hypothetical protein DFH11DRAFT_1515335 [Phellopilus nigrolimitatus]
MHAPNVKFSPPNALLSAHSDHFPHNALDDSSFTEPSPPFTSSLKPNEEQDESIQDAEWVPYSSTPDLRSQASSPSDSGSGSQAVKTPPENLFTCSLFQKLRALADDPLQNYKRIKFCQSDNLQESQETSPGSFAVKSCALSDNGTESADAATGRSTLSSSSNGALKRKRAGSSSRYAEANSVEVETDVESSPGNKHDPIRPSVPVSKKLKETSFTYTATETASSRRAHSLSACPSFTSTDSLDATEPASPTGSATPVDPLPAVAPLEFTVIPRPAAAANDVAKARLKVLLQKEKARRKREGFEGGINVVFDNNITQDEINTFLGIDEDFRREVIKWMLYVTPSKKLRVAELREHLLSNPETRFQAIMLFSHYFMRVGDAMPKATKKETPLMKLGRQRITWDVAVSCLALAVKFQRDFLEPLNPIYSREFLVIAPHPMSHDDFEISQKDVLEALEYEVRQITPEPFMEEIWNSLPTLRKLLGFVDGWEVTQMNAWHRLNAAASEGEMFQFPMSLLASSALIEGGVEALVAYYGSDMETRVGRELTGAEEMCVDDLAMLAFVDVIEDVQNLVGIVSDDLDRCRDWLRHTMNTA